LRSAFVLIFFLILCISSGAQTLMIPERDWVWGISHFRGLELEEEDSRILESIPDQIAGELGEIRGRKMLSQEIETLFNETKEKEISQKRKTVSDLIGQIDKDFFLRTLSPEDRRELEQSLLDARRDLQEAQEAVFDQEQVLRWSAQWKKGNDSLTLSLEGADPTSLARKQGLDYLIYGEIKRIEDYIRLKILGYNAILGMTDLLIEESFAAEDLTSRIQGWTGPMRSRLLGEPWGGLSIRVEPSDAAILQDGRVLGYGAVDLLNETPGPLSLEIVRLGFETQMIELDIPTEAVLRQTVELQSLELGTLAVDTAPPGADVYLGSQWLGKTPYLGEAPTVDSQVTLILSGYFNENLFPRAFESTEESLVMTPREERQTLQEAKDDFYTSLGWFTLSFFGTMMMQDIHNNLLNQYQYYLSVNPGAGFQLQRNIAFTLEQTSFWTMIGMGAVSGGLFIMTLMELDEYIKIGENNYQ
jgi:hypothetical protein